MEESNEGKKQARAKGQMLHIRQEERENCKVIYNLVS